MSKDTAILKKDLVSTAKDLNDVMGLEPPIVTGGKSATPEQLKDDIINVMPDISWESDAGDFDDTTIATLKALGYEVPPEEDEADEPEAGEEAEEEAGDGSANEPEPEPEPDQAEPADEPKDKTKPAPAKKKKTKGTGVIASIVAAIETAGKKGITKAEILEKLKKDFPDRDAEAMKKTINVQVPNRITKEKFKVGKMGTGKYYKEG